MEPSIQWVTIPHGFIKWGPRNTEIDSIVLHCTEGGPDAEASAKHALLSKDDPGYREASFHNVIGRNGAIWGVVPWERMAWHCPTKKGTLKPTWNQRSIGIEHCALPNEALTPEQEQASANLILWLMQKFPRITMDRITAHRFTGWDTSCPDSLWPDEQALEDWKRRLLGGGPPVA